MILPHQIQKKKNKEAFNTIELNLGVIMSQNDFVSKILLGCR